LRTVPACWGKVLDAPASAFDSKWCSSSDMASLDGTQTPAPKQQASQPLVPPEEIQQNEVPNQEQGVLNSEVNLSGGRGSRVC
jgi:hypothetical protein